MCVAVRRKHAEDIIVFMDGFPVVPSLLLIPPIGVGVTELARYCWGVDVAAILRAVDQQEFIGATEGFQQAGRFKQWW